VCESGAVSPAPDEYYKEWPPLYQQIVNGGPAARRAPPRAAVIR